MKEKVVPPHDELAQVGADFQFTELFELREAGAYGQSKYHFRFVFARGKIVFIALLKERAENRAEWKIFEKWVRGVIFRSLREKRLPRIAVDARLAGDPYQIASEIFALISRLKVKSELFL